MKHPYHFIGSAISVKSANSVSRRAEPRNDLKEFRTDLRRFFSDMSDTVYAKQGNVLTVKPADRLDTVTSPVLENEMRQHLDGITEIIMDFSEVRYISSSGIRVLLAVHQLMENRGGSMKLIQVNEFVTEIFDLVGFMDMVTVERD